MTNEVALVFLHEQKLYSFLGVSFNQRTLPTSSFYMKTLSIPGTFDITAKNMQQPQPFFLLFTSALQDQPTES